MSLACKNSRLSSILSAQGCFDPSSKDFVQERPLFSQAIPVRDSKAKIVNHIITGVKKIRVFHTSSTPTISNAAIQSHNTQNSQELVRNRRNVTDRYCERLILIILQLKLIRKQTSGKKRIKPCRVLNLSVTHPCASGQWFEFLMHSDYDLQKGHLPDDVILLLIDQNPSGVPFLCKFGLLLLNPRRDNEMKRILVEEVK